MWSKFKMIAFSGWATPFRGLIQNFRQASPPLSYGSPPRIASELLAYWIILVISKSTRARSSSARYVNRPRWTNRPRETVLDMSIPSSNRRGRWIKDSHFSGGTSRILSSSISVIFFKTPLITMSWMILYKSCLKSGDPTNVFCTISVRRSK